MSELQELSGKALLPGFSDDDDQEELIVSTVNEISQLFKGCERRLKEMQRTKSEGSADEVRVAPQHRQRAATPPQSRDPSAMAARGARLTHRAVARCSRSCGKTSSGALLSSCRTSAPSSGEATRAIRRSSRDRPSRSASTTMPNAHVNVHA